MPALVSNTASVGSSIVRNVPQRATGAVQGRAYKGNCPFCSIFLKTESLKKSLQLFFKSSKIPPYSYQHSLSTDPKGQRTETLVTDLPSPHTDAESPHPESLQDVRTSSHINPTPLHSFRGFPAQCFLGMPNNLGLGKTEGGSFLM